MVEIGERNLKGVQFHGGCYVKLALIFHIGYHALFQVDLSFYVQFRGGCHVKLAGECIN